ncbi:MAG: cytochrome c3 family protein [Pirellulaceae bacterium]|nr:cytochrome c3 family protein [Planctomycetales bacterium]
MRKDNSYRTADHVQVKPAEYALSGALLACLCIGVLTSCKLPLPDPFKPEARLDLGWPGRTENTTPDRPPIHVDIPVIAGAKYVNNDELCQVCHKTYHESFASNVHRNNGCESCHGPASKHLESRGSEPGSVLSFTKLKKAERSEICAQCHAQDACTPGQTWRTSEHAHHGVACTDCHSKGHYNIPEGTPTTVPDYAALEKPDWISLVANISKAGGEDILKKRGPEEQLPSLRGTSNNLGAVMPVVCYACHGDKYDLERVAHPHQINGPHAMQCNTCHDPHGSVREHARKNLCLECHNNSSPNLTWHTSLHDKVGVRCTDCHNPHPEASVRKVVDINHTAVQRPQRLPMSVDEPNVCYRCHQTQFAQAQLPSHHPVREGKMSCSDCHDPHGQNEGNLKAETVNMLCYKCHADKQGPFVHQHAPVEENCSICHNPHGTTANNLLHQPTTFLCLRCHTGHRSPPSDHFGIGTSDIDNLAYQRPVLFTDCTQCHQQVHGSDQPSQLIEGAFFR